VVRTILIAASVLAGCGTPAGFGCEDDAQCGEGGVCAAPGYCAFSDPACESGLVFGAHAGELAGLCVMPEGGSGGADGAGSGTSEGPEATQGLTTASPGDSTLALDDGSSGATTGDGSTLTASASSSSTTATDGGDVSSTTGGDPRPITVELVADLAQCAYPDNVDPAPAQCAAVAGAGAFTVDLDDGSGFGSAVGYLAFTIGPEVDDGTILDVALRLRTTAATNASSDHAGEVWQVEPFDTASLAVATPAPLGDAPIAADIGAVEVSADATWSLPLDLVAGAAIHLAIVPISTNGADYADASSAVPPVIEATLAP
jgi:hypothetical protein